MSSRMFSLASAIEEPPILTTMVSPWNLRMKGRASTSTPAFLTASSLSTLMAAPFSSGVVGVDVHVFGGEVAAVRGGGAIAESELAADADLVALEGSPDLVKVDLGDAGAVVEDDRGAHGHGQLVQHQLRAGAAEGGDNAAPVGIAAVDGGLDQIGAGDGARQGAGVGFAGGADDGDGEHLSGALAVAGALLAEVNADLLQGHLEGLQPVAWQERPATGGAIGEDRQHVVGAGVTVHGDQVEAAFNTTGEHLAQLGSGHGGVGGQEPEHGGHVDVDHS